MLLKLIYSLSLALVDYASSGYSLVLWLLASGRSRNVADCEAISNDVLTRVHEELSLQEG